MMARAKIPKTLGEDTFKWINNKRNPRMPGHPPDSKKDNAVRQRFFYIRQVAQKEIADLTRLAEILPEDQQDQIFNDQKLYPFLKALLHFSTDYGISREGDELIYTPEAEERRQRLLKLCYDIIGLLDNSGFAGLLAPTVWNVTIKEGGALPHLRAIYYQSLIGDRRITVRKTA